MNFISRKENLKETLTITLEETKERGINTVLIVSTRDYCDLESLRFFEGNGLRVIMVTYQIGYMPQGVQLQLPDNKDIFEDARMIVHMGTGVLTGGGYIGVSTQRQTKVNSLDGRLSLIVPLIATRVTHTLKIFSHGIKVCSQIGRIVAGALLVNLYKKVALVAKSYVRRDTVRGFSPSILHITRDLKTYMVIEVPLTAEKLFF